MLYASVATTVADVLLLICLNDVDVMVADVFLVDLIARYGD